MDLVQKEENCFKEQIIHHFMSLLVTNIPLRQINIRI